MCSRFLYALILSLSLSVSWAQTWTIDTLPALPEPVTNQAVSEGFENGVPMVYSFGGLDSTKLFSGIHQRSWRFHTGKQQWEPLPPVPDTLGKIAAAASRIGDIIYLIGGYHVFADGNERSSNKVHRFNTQQNRFLSDGAPIPVPIDDQVQAVWRDSLIFVITGWSDRENVPDVQIYDPANDRWQVGTPVPDNTRFASFGASGVIVGDVIYYFGGAAMGANFPIQNQLRIGNINPADPTQVQWKDTVLSANLVGYRMAVTHIGDFIFWLGGSGVTYNYNGIAYNGSGGVEPLKRSLLYHIPSKGYNEMRGIPLPMDLRGVARTDQRTHFLIGGMEASQRVSDHLLKLTYNGSLPLTTTSSSFLPELKFFHDTQHRTIQVVQGCKELRQSELIVDLTDVSGKSISQWKLNPCRKIISLPELSSGMYVITWKMGRASGQYLFRVDQP
ncbi:MAG: hypothetical protein AAGI38_15130 [Bacteroidota bacterium]